MGQHKYGGWAGNQWGGFRVVNYAETTSKGDTTATVHWYRYLEVWGAVQGNISTSWAGRIWVDHHGGNHDNYAVQEGRSTVGYSSGEPWGATSASIQTYSLGYWASDLGGWVYYPDKPSYTVTYDANGGSGKPDDQSKTWGEEITLSNVSPTRNLYNFLGWASTNDAKTAEYAVGSKYTANANATLYAVWELAYIPPKITNCTVNRIDSDTGATATFNFEADNTIKSDNVITQARIRIRDVDTTTWFTIGEWTPNTRTGSITTSDFKNRMGLVDSDCRYEVEFMVKDTYDYAVSTVTTTLKLDATTATPIMNVKLVKNTDYAGPNKINEALKIFDKLGVDYVVSEHVSSTTENPNAKNWWWRIWKSGKIECGIDRYYAGTLNLETTTLLEGLYQTETISFGNYPSELSFLYIPFATISFQYDDTLTGSSRNCWISIAGDGTTEAPPSFSLVDHSKNQISPYVSLYAVGRSR